MICAMSVAPPEIALMASNMPYVAAIITPTPAITMPIAAMPYSAPVIAPAPKVLPIIVNTAVIAVKARSAMVNDIAAFSNLPESNIVRTPRIAAIDAIARIIMPRLTNDF